MAGSVEFHSNVIAVKGTINKSVDAFLYDVGELVKGAAADASPVDQGQLRGSWDYEVEEGKAVTIGSPLQNAIWNEFGTGEHAEGSVGGRQGGWYVDGSQLTAKAKTRMSLRYGKDGKEWYFTRGKRANHTLQKVVDQYKSAIITRAQEILSGLGDE